jgi:hypothetical protein
MWLVRYGFQVVIRNSQFRCEPKNQLITLFLNKVLCSATVIIRGESQFEVFPSRH